MNNINSKELPLVSVIIPTFNRFMFLLNAIDSVKKQTYPNIEIIVINDMSTQQEYYTFDFSKLNIKYFTLEIGSKNKFGHGCAAYVRNFGIEKATGDYIAFLDDDDIWLPNKLELQIKYMKEYNCKMSSTDGYYGNGIYNPNIKYLKYNAEKYFNCIKNIFSKKSSVLFENGFPTIWNKEFLSIHNTVICSSCIISKDIIDKIGLMKNVRYGEDYDYWLRALEHTNLVYIDEPCFYYDGSHGHGQNY